MAFVTGDEVRICCAFISNGSPVGSVCPWIHSLGVNKQLVSNKRSPLVVSLGLPEQWVKLPTSLDSMMGVLLHYSEGFPFHTQVSRQAVSL